MYYIYIGLAYIAMHIHVLQTMLSPTPPAACLIRVSDHAHTYIHI